MNIDQFYNKKDLVESSRRGYYQEKIDFFISELKSNKNKKIKILDVGCNDGELTQKYSKYGEVIGIDISKKAIRECKKKGINCLLSDLESLPKKYDNFFDIVMAGDIIEHIFDTDNFLKHAHRVLKKDGILLLTTPNLASFGRRLMLLIGVNPFIEYSVKFPNETINVGHIRYYTKADLELQFSNLGFKNITIYGDRINITQSLHLPFSIANRFPSFSRNLMVKCFKK